MTRRYDALAEAGFQPREHIEQCLVLGHPDLHQGDVGHRIIDDVLADTVRQLA